MLKNCDQKTIMLCDVEGCTGRAVTAFAVKGKKRQINLCSNCRFKLYAGIAQQIVPKSPRNRIAAASEERSSTIKRLDDET